MNLLRPAALLALAAPIAAAAFTAGPAAAGGDPVTVLYPSAVNVQLVRAEKLLEKATLYEDEGDIPKAVAALAATRSHMRKAWTAAKYVIDTAPPPVAADGGFATLPKATNKPRIVPRAKATSPKAKRKTKAKAHTSGGAIPGASPYADQYTTAVAVLSLQHDIATTAIGMLDNASEPLLTSVSTSLFAALNARDQAIAYIHSVDIPPVATDAGAPAHASDEVAVGWAVVMPPVAPLLDDEVQQIEALRVAIKLSPGRKRILDDAELQDIKTSSTLATYWPPAPPEA